MRDEGFHELVGVQRYSEEGLHRLLLFRFGRSQDGRGEDDGDVLAVHLGDGAVLHNGPKEPDKPMEDRLVTGR